MNISRGVTKILHTEARRRGEHGGRKGRKKNLAETPKRGIAKKEEKKVKKKKEKKTNAIGTQNESSLHRTLKFQYAGSEGKTEEVTGEFVADGVTKTGEIIEVQTGSFGPLRKKVEAFAANGKVRIIHPIAVNKIIEVYEPVKPKKKSQKKSTPNSSLLAPHSLLSRRKSPVHASSWNIFDALLYAPRLPLLKNVSIEIVLADITEKRLKDGKGARRRKGISIKDKELTAFHERIVFSKPKDFLRFVPFKKNEEFTVSLLAEKTGVKPLVARKAVYVLSKMNLVKRVGKRGNCWVYVVG